MTRLLYAGVRFWSVVQWLPAIGCAEEGRGGGLAIAFPSAFLLSAPSLSARATGPEAHTSCSSSYTSSWPASPSLTLLTRGQDKHPSAVLLLSCLVSDGAWSAPQGHRSRFGQQKSCCLAKLSHLLRFSSYAPRLRTRWLIRHQSITDFSPAPCLLSAGHCCNRERDIPFEPSCPRSQSKLESLNL